MLYATTSASIFHLQNGTILESPLDDISLRRNTAFDMLALFQSRPEVAEVLELDQVPDIAELCLYDDGLGDRGWDT